MCPDNGSATRRLLPFLGSAGTVPRVQRYYEALRVPAARPATLRFLRMTVTTPRACVRSAKPDAGLEPGVFGLVTPRRPVIIDVETAGRPKFLGNPPVPTPCSSTPAGSTPPGHCGELTRSPMRQRRGLQTKGNFGAQSHGFSTHCLRFVRWVTPQDARLASGCWPALPDGIDYPQSSDERFP